MTIATGIQVIDTVVTTAFTELEDSPQEHYPLTGFEATRTFKCAWADRHTLAGELRGGISDVNGVLTVVRPATYPAYPLAVVHDVQIKPFSGVILDTELNRAGGNSSQEAQALLTVQYRVPSPNNAATKVHPEDDSGVLREFSVEPSVEYLTMPEGGLFWQPGQIALGNNQGIGLRLYRLVINVTLSNLRELPEGALRLSGTVNEAAMSFPELGTGWVFQTETLLFVPGEARQSVREDGERVWSIPYRWHYKEETWNKFARSNGEFEAVYRQVGEGENAIGAQRYRPYPLDDHTKLLEVS